MRLKGRKEKGEKEKEVFPRHSALDAESPTWYGIAGLLNLIQYRNDEGIARRGSLYLCH